MVRDELDTLLDTLRQFEKEFLRLSGDDRKIIISPSAFVLMS